MHNLLYFAYGSNMSTPRLRYRVTGCRFVFVARLPKYRLCFHKRSNDGSAKCNAFKTVTPSDVVIGAVYEMPANEKPALDRAEGLGPTTTKDGRVRSPKARKSGLIHTSPTPHAIDDSLKPIRGTRILSWQVPQNISCLTYVEIT